MHQAVESRTFIGQATGILMARRGLTADEAFEVLSRTSQDHNIKLARLAAVLTEAPEIADQI
nr:ANTAR domain-containing protein [Actinoallomurus iriomotensis]